MIRFWSISIWTLLLLCLVQHSISIPQMGQMGMERPMFGGMDQQVQQRFQQQISSGNDLIDALEDLYVQNNAQISDIGMAIKQSMIDSIDQWAIDPSTTRYVVLKLDESLIQNPGRAGELWRKMRRFITSGVAAQLMRNVDLKVMFKNIMSRIDVDSLMDYMVSPSMGGGLPEPSMQDYPPMQSF